MQRVTYCDPGKAKGLDYRKAGYCTTYHVADCGTANKWDKGPTPINQARWVYRPGKTSLVRTPHHDAHVTAYRDALALMADRLSRLADRFGR